MTFANIKLTIAAALAIGSSASIAAPATYHLTVTDLGSLGGNESVGNGINDFGEVVGSSKLSNGRDQAFIYSNGAMQSLGLLEGINNNRSRANSINDKGQITGTAFVGFSTYAFLYSDGKMHDLGTLSPDGSHFSSGRGVNNLGQVTGSSSGAFIYRNGTMAALTAQFSDGFAINDLGQVAGRASSQTGVHAFLFNPDGSSQDLGTLGGNGSIGYAINNLGQVTGGAPMGIPTNPLQKHAFLYHNGFMQDLGTLGGTDSESYGINDLEHVVGTAKTSTDKDHAFLYSNGIMQDLNSFNGVASSGLTLTQANDINNLGQITGLSYDNANARDTAFLLSVDEVVWENAYSGRWSSANWSLAMTPTRLQGVTIDPARS
jgi:probable HAF family extracellular repeat protein